MNATESQEEMPRQQQVLLFVVEFMEAAGAAGFTLSDKGRAELAVLKAKEVAPPTDDEFAAAVGALAAQEEKQITTDGDPNYEALH